MGRPVSQLTYVLATASMFSRARNVDQSHLPSRIIYLGLWLGKTAVLASSFWVIIYKSRPARQITSHRLISTQQPISHVSLQPIHRLRNSHVERPSTFSESQKGRRTDLRGRNVIILGFRKINLTASLNPMYSSQKQTKKDDIIFKALESEHCHKKNMAF